MVKTTVKAKVTRKGKGREKKRVKTKGKKKENRNPRSQDGQTLMTMSSQR